MFFGGSEFTVKILSVHLLKWDKRNVNIPPKRSFAISYREVGDCEFIMDGEVTRGESGDIFYFPKGIGYKITAGRERLYGINFEYTGEIPQKILKLKVKKHAFFATAFSEIYRIWTSKESGYYARALSYFYRIISEIVRESEEEERTPVYERIKPALTRIYEGYGDPELSVGSLAAYIGVSDTYFRRAFEATLGKRPREFINELRISYAKEYLESGFYNIEKVSEMCGFRDTKYFSTVFKKYTGMSPSQYIKTHLS